MDKFLPILLSRLGDINFENSLDHPDVKKIIKRQGIQKYKESFLSHIQIVNLVNQIEESYPHIKYEYSKGSIICYVPETEHKQAMVDVQEIVKELNIDDKFDIHKVFDKDVLVHKQYLLFDYDKITSKAKNKALTNIIY